MVYQSKRFMVYQSKRFGRIITEQHIQLPARKTFYINENLVLLYGFDGNVQNKVLFQL